MSETIEILIIVCPLVFIAGFIDSIAGGGGLISLPAYLAAGIPPHVAAATNKCSSTFGTMVSAIKYFKDGRIKFSSAGWSAVGALIGSYIGAEINMLVSEEFLRYFMLVAVPLISVFLIFKKDFGSKDESAKHSKVAMAIISFAIGLVIGFYDGFFGPGTGTFLTIAFTTIAGFDLLTASGNTKLVNLCSNVSAFVAFAIGGNIFWEVGIVAAIFGILGNYLGAHLALTKGAKFIRPMFFIVLALLTLNMIMEIIGG